MKKIFSKKNVITFLAFAAVMMMSTVAFAAGEDGETVVSMFHATFWALVPPIVAIGLALITKEVYSSLFIGIVLGGLLSANFAPVATLDNLLNEGLIAAVSSRCLPACFCNRYFMGNAWNTYSYCYGDI